jgi:ADP-ribose pyrophosphatase
LPVETVTAAFEALEGGDADVALCPTADGGFCVLAVNGDFPGLLADIAWSTAQVFPRALANAEQGGLRVRVLSPWYDVDGPEDLARLAGDLAGNVSLGAAATRAALRALRDAGLPIPTGQLPWHVLERRTLHSTPWRSLISDRVSVHTGAVIDYSYLETERAVWVVPVTDAGRVILVRQYRHPIGEIILEVPAGSGSADPLQIAADELREETGGRARELHHIATYYPASAHTTHSGHVVLALGVTLGAPEREATELLDTVSVPIELAFDMARRGEIADAQSALAILAAEPAIRAACDRQ